MREDIKDALENVQTTGIDTTGFGPYKRHSFNYLLLIIKSFLTDIPEAMTVRELLEELED